MLEDRYDSKINTFIMIGKRVIWASKQKKLQPNISHSKANLKDYLVTLKMCKTINNQNFDIWWISVSALLMIIIYSKFSTKFIIPRIGIGQCCT